MHTLCDIVPSCYRIGTIIYSRKKKLLEIIHNLVASKLIILNPEFPTAHHNLAIMAFILNLGIQDLSH